MGCVFAAFPMHRGVVEVEADKVKIVIFAQDGGGVGIGKITTTTTKFFYIH